MPAAVLGTEGTDIMCVTQSSWEGRHENSAVAPKGGFCTEDRPWSGQVSQSPGHFKRLPFRVGSC